VGTKVAADWSGSTVYREPLTSSQLERLDSRGIHLEDYTSELYTDKLNRRKLQGTLNWEIIVEN
jgi:hypothetical protein